MSGTEWLSEGVEKLIAEIDASGPDPSEPLFDIAIVGSGYGGAVAAARLAGAHDSKGRPVRVCVLERGREYLPGDFPERLGDLPAHVRMNLKGDPKPRAVRDGLFDLRLGGEVSAVLGSGLGGGSLINAGVLARPADSVMHSAAWPEALRTGLRDEHFCKVETMLGAATIPLDDPDYPKPLKLSALERLAQGIGGRARAHRATIAVTFEPGENSAGVRQAKCIRCGDCMTGCNHDAKNTLARNYLPLARRRGAHLFTGTTVVSIEPRGTKPGWVLNLAVTSSAVAKRLPRGTAMRLWVRRVILAGGTFGSTEILMRSPAVARSGRLGERFSANGDMLAAGYKMRAEVNAAASEEIEPARRQVGPTITGMVDLRDVGPRRARGLVIEELAVPAGLRRLFEELVTTFGGLYAWARKDDTQHAPDADGQDPAAIDQRAVLHTAVYAVMGNDEAKGKLRLSEGEALPDANGGIEVEWKDVGRQYAFGQGVDTLERAHARIGGEAMPYPLWRPIPEKLVSTLGNPAGAQSVITVHPLGGCPMAESGKRGVVDALGQVFCGEGKEVHDGLVVLDGSIVPLALGINPCLTIAAIAEFAVDGLKRCWGLRSEGDALDSLPPQPEILRPPFASPRTTDVRLAEIMEGTVTVPDAGGGPQMTIAVTARIEYEPIENLPSFLVGLRKTLRLREGTSQIRLLWSLPPGKVGIRGQSIDLTLPLKGRLHLLQREASSPEQRMDRAFSAYWKMRGKRDAWQLLFGGEAPGGRPDKPPPGPFQRYCDGRTLASHAGEVRLLRYELEISGDVPPVDGRAYFRQGDRLVGTKRLAYVERGNPWRQLTELELFHIAKGTSEEVRLGILRVDPMHFVRAHAVQLQTLTQEDQPHALADLLSLGMYLLRVITNIHIWSLRRPDYPKCEVDYEFGQGTDQKFAQRRRLPGEIDGLPKPKPCDLEAPAFVSVPGQVTVEKLSAGGRIRLTRYPSRQSAGADPVLMIHGYGASGTTFALPSIEMNLVRYLVERGYEVWVLDLRTSIGLDSSRAAQWTFEDVAYGDIPLAICAVLEETGRPRVNIVAHCVGAAMFCMAVLGGAIRDVSTIRAAVLSQVGPLVRLPGWNRAKGYVAGYMKDMLQVDELNITAPRSAPVELIDRLLNSYPYPDEEWDAHHPEQPWDTVPGEAYCNRAHALFGRLFEHANLNRATLSALGDLLGHVRVKTFRQAIYYATRGRLTDTFGRNRYATYEAVARYLRFPVCLVHGLRNRVFAPQTSIDSFDYLQWVLSAPGVAAPADGSLSRCTADHRLCLELFPGFGHQDCLIGERAHTSVYPRIASFLGASFPDFQVKGEPPLVAVYPGRLGPVLGWLRKISGGHMARILFAPDDRLSRPAYALTIVLGRMEQGCELHELCPLPGYAMFHELARDTGAKGFPHAFHRADGLPAMAKAMQALDVPLPESVADYLVVVLTVNFEFPEGPPKEDEIRGPWYLSDGVSAHFPRENQVSTRPLNHEEFATLVEPVLDACGQGDLLSRFAPVELPRRVADPGYEDDVSVAFLRKEALAAAHVAVPAPAEKLCFAFGSCRYAASVFDRELADRAFGRLRDRIGTHAATPSRPQLLLLIGDQIYADATAGLFDPDTGVDRFDRKYEEAWGAPNAREVMRRTPTYPMLDDHEVEENWEARAGPHAPEHLADGLAAFELYQRGLAPANPIAESGYWYAFNAAGHEIFVADTRSRRHRGGRLDCMDDRIMSEAQFAELERWLTACHTRDPSTPKFIASASVLAPWVRASRGDPSYARRADGWDAFPASLHRILRYIAQRQIVNVVFLCGDYHASMLCRLTVAASGGAPVVLHSIVSSGLYAPFPFANVFSADIQLEYSGWHHDWLGMPAPEAGSELSVAYTTSHFTARDSFAVLRAERTSRGTWRLDLEFDADAGATKASIEMT
jgi:choline dehydrogenase-like flavoprotein